jgi:hypothetical protein
MWTPTKNELVYDNYGVCHKIVFVASDKQTVVTTVDKNVFVFDKSFGTKYNDRDSEDCFIIGPYDDDVWQRFQEYQEIVND